MSEEDKLVANRQTLGEQTLSITTDQFLEFVAEKRSNGPCESCGTEHWIYAQDEDGPSIMGTYNVRSDATSNWFFWMICTNCSNTRLIGAGQVWEHYFGSKEDSE